MTKLLILSDSHGTLEYMLHAVRRCQPDLIVHLGDHCADAQRLSQQLNTPLVSLRGNCDYWCSDVPERWSITLAGVPILALHGHQLGVKAGLLRLRYAALEAGAQLVLFGHTHLPCCQQEDGLWFVNPGACKSPRPTCALAELDNGAIQCRILNLYTEEAI